MNLRAFEVTEISACAALTLGNVIVHYVSEYWSLGNSKADLIRCKHPFKSFKYFRYMRTWIEDWHDSRVRKSCSVLVLSRSSSFGYGTPVRFTASLPAIQRFYSPIKPLTRPTVPVIGVNLFIVVSRVNNSIAVPCRIRKWTLIYNEAEYRFLKHILITNNLYSLFIILQYDRLPMKLKHV